MPLLELSIGQHLLHEVKQTTLLEWIGAFTGIVCVYLAAKQSIINWPVAIISVVAYTIVFYRNQLYGDAGLQLYFLGTSIYGWYFWLKKEEKHEKPVTVLKGRKFFWITAGTILLSAILGLFLKNFTPTNVPYIDGFCTAVSFIAQLLMSRKVLQNWVLWIFIDICYVPLYIYKNLYVTALLYAILLIPAWLGYTDWKRAYKSSVANR